MSRGGWVEYMDFYRRAVKSRDVSSAMFRAGMATDHRGADDLLEALMSYSQICYQTKNKHHKTRLQFAVWSRTPYLHDEFEFVLREWSTEEGGQRLKRVFALRAMQGHSILGLCDDSVGKQITKEHAKLIGTGVHGT